MTSTSRISPAPPPPPAAGHRLRRPPAWSVALAVVTVALLEVPAGVAAPASRQVVAGNAAEAWYTSTPVAVCTSPVGCPAELGTGAVAPAHTLQVAVAAGTERARAYVVPDLTGLSRNADLLSAQLTLPLAGEDGSGTSSPELAVVKACLTTEPVQDGTNGSLQAPPAVDCTVSTFATYDASSSRLTVDMLTFFDAWAAGAAQNGIALIPDPSQGGASDSWQLTLNGRERAGVPRAATTVLVALDRSSAVSEPTAQLPEEGFAPVLSPLPADLAPALTPLPPAISEQLAASPPLVAALEPSAEASAPLGQAVQQAAFVGEYRYRLAFLVPFLLAAGFLIFSRMFIRELAPLTPRAAR